MEQENRLYKIRSMTESNYFPNQFFEKVVKKIVITCNGRINMHRRRGKARPEAIQPTQISQMRLQVVRFVSFVTRYIYTFEMKREKKKSNDLFKRTRLGFEF